MSRVALNPLRMELLFKLRDELAHAEHGRKGELVKRYASSMDVAVPTVHRWLKHQLQVGRPRKRRSDAGKSVMKVEWLESIARVLLGSHRATGKRLMSATEALELLQDNNRVPADVRMTEGRLQQLLRDKGLHPAQLTLATPAGQQRSLFPNHVWQVDASVCTAYYLSNATGLKYMAKERFYKNKPQNLTRIQEERLIRYVVTDHLSNSVLVRYYLGSESTENLTDFLIWGMTKREGHPMHGVPFILQMDRGSANTSKATLNMLDQLQVRWMVHERHNSRANGSVEQMHNEVETRFESKLRFQRVQSLDDLNAKALLWAHRFCAEVVQGRHKQTRHAKWMSIKPEQLRIAPPVEVLRALPTGNPVKRRVDNNLWVKFAVPGSGSHQYDLRHIPNIMPGKHVMVRLNALEKPGIQVQYLCPEDGKEKWQAVRPVERDEHGFVHNAPVIGEELRAGPRGIVDRQRDQAKMLLYGGSTAKEADANRERGALPYDGELNPFKRDLPAAKLRYLPPRGMQQQLQVVAAEPASVSIVAFMKQVMDARKRCGTVARTGGDPDPFVPAMRTWLHAQHPDERIPEPLAKAYLTSMVEGRLPGAAELPTARAVGQ